MLQIYTLKSIRTAYVFATTLRYSLIA